MANKKSAEKAGSQKQDSIDVPLSSPYESGGVLRETITVKRPQVGELLNVNLHDLMVSKGDAVVTVLQSCGSYEDGTPVGYECLTAMDYSDFIAVAGVFIAFLKPKALLTTMPGTSTSVN